MPPTSTSALASMPLTVGVTQFVVTPPDHTSVTAWWDSYELEVSVLVSR